MCRVRGTCKQFKDKGGKFSVEAAAAERHGAVCLPGESGMEPAGHGPLKDPGKDVLWSDEQSGE